MDLSLLGEIKFGEGAVYQIKYKCSWCGGVLNNQTEERFKSFGNCCPACNTKYAQNAFNKHTEREVTATDRLIRQTREEMDILAIQLDRDISEQERKQVVDEMEKKFIKIKMLKRE
jgi:ribosomal protein L37AE/L43A